MSNRVVAFLVLIAMFLIGGILAWWYLAKGVSQIVLHLEWPANMSVKLYKGGSSMLENECHPGDCTLEKIPPFAYQLKVTWDGYVPYIEDLDIKSNSIIERSVKLERNITLGEFHTKEASTKIARKNLSSSIETASGIIIGGYKTSVFYFEQTKDGNYALMKADTTNGSGSASKNAKQLQLFTTTDIPETTVFNENDALAGLKVGKDSLIFDAESGKVTLFAWVNPEKSSGTPEDSTIKNITRAGKNLVISTPIGAVILANDGTLSAHPLYDDIIALPSGDLLGLVRADSSAKKALLNFDSSSESAIYLDKKNGGRELVLRTSDRLDHFAKEWDDYLTINDDGSKQVIENITK